MRNTLLLLCVAVAAVSAANYPVGFITINSTSGSQRDFYWTVPAANATSILLGSVSDGYNYAVWGNGATTAILFLIGCQASSSNCGIWTADLTAASPSLFWAAAINQSYWESGTITGSVELAALQGLLVFTDTKNNVWASDRCVLNTANTQFALQMNPSGWTLPANFTTLKGVAYPLTPRLEWLQDTQNNVYLGSTTGGSAPLASGQPMTFIDNYGGFGAVDASGNYYIVQSNTVQWVAPTSAISNTTLNCSALTIEALSAIFATTDITNTTLWNVTADALADGTFIGTTVYFLTVSGNIYSYSPNGQLTFKVQVPAGSFTDPTMSASADGTQLVVYTNSVYNGQIGWVFVYTVANWGYTAAQYNLTGYSDAYLKPNGIYYFTNNGQLIFQPATANFSAANVYGTNVGSNEADNFIWSLASLNVYDFKSNVKTTCDGVDSCSLAAPPAFPTPTAPPAVPAPLAPPPAIPTDAVRGTVQVLFTITGADNTSAAGFATLFTNGTTMDNKTHSAAEVLSEIEGGVGEQLLGDDALPYVLFELCSIVVADLNGNTQSFPVNSSGPCGNSSFTSPTFNASNNTVSFLLNVAVWSNTLPINVPLGFDKANLTELAGDASMVIAAATDFTSIVITIWKNTVTEVAIPPPSSPPPAVVPPSAPVTNVDGSVKLSFTLTDATNATLDSIAAAFNGSNNTAAASLVSALADSLSSLVKNNTGAATVTVYACKVVITNAAGVPTTIQLTASLSSLYNATECANAAALEERFVTLATGPSVSIIAFFVASDVPASTLGSAVATAVQNNAGGASVSTVIDVVQSVSGQRVTIAVTATTSGITTYNNSPPPAVPSTTTSPPPPSSAAGLQFVFAVLAALQLVWLVAAF